MTDVVSKTEAGEPPPKERRRYDWAAIAEDLRAHPKEWRLVFTQDSTTFISAIAQGSIPALREDRGFSRRQANTVRSKVGQVDRRKADLYLMYDPELDEMKEKKS